MLHDPFHVVDTAAAQKVTAVIASIIVPQNILQRENLLAVQGIQDILIRKKQFPAVKRHIVKQRLWSDCMPPGFQIDQQDAEDVVVAGCPRPQLVEAVGQLR